MKETIITINNRKDLSKLTVEDAKVILAIIRPMDDKRMHRVLRNEQT